MEKDFWALYNLLLQDRPLLADAVIWLQGDRYDRAEKVLAIYRAKLAPLVVISGNNLLVGPGPRAGETNINVVEMRDYLLENGVKEGDILIDEGALNTLEQAKRTIQLARQKSWSKIILVSSAYHQPRVCLTFWKQLELNPLALDIYHQPVVMELSQRPGGRAATVQELCTQEIAKITEYSADVASISEALNYLKSKRI